MAKTPKPYRHYAKFEMLVRIKGGYTPAMMRTLRWLNEDFRAIALDEYERCMERIH